MRPYSIPLWTILTKCPETRRAAVEIALLGPRRLTGPAPSAPCRLDPRRQRQEQRVEATDGVARTADHQAIAALEPPDSPARAAVEVVDALGDQLFCRAADVVVVVGVAAVNDLVAGGQKREESVEGRIHGRGRHHQPDGPGRRQPGEEILERRGAFADRPVRDQVFDRGGGACVADHRVLGAQPAPRHVDAHSAEPDQAEWHSTSPSPSLVRVTGAPLSAVAGRSRRPIMIEPDGRRLRSVPQRRSGQISDAAEALPAEDTQDQCHHLRFGSQPLGLVGSMPGNRRYRPSGAASDRPRPTPLCRASETGSNGRIGEAVMRRFAGRFDQVVGFDRKADNPPPPDCGARSRRDHLGRERAAGARGDPVPMP